MHEMMVEQPACMCDKVVLGRAKNRDGWWGGWPVCVRGWGMEIVFLSDFEVDRSEFGWVGDGRGIGECVGMRGDGWGKSLNCSDRCNCTII